MVCIGISKFDHHPDLDGVADDAKALCDAAAKAGWDTLLFNKPEQTTRAGLVQALTEVERRGQAYPYEAVMLYQSAHGIEIHGVNYLIPSDAPPTTKFDPYHPDLSRRPTEFTLQETFLKTQDISAVLGKTRAKLVVHWLDQCRTDPYYRSRFKDTAGPPLGALPTKDLIGPIWTNVQAEGHVRVYLTSSGQVAYNSSVAAKELAKYLDPASQTGNLPLRTVISRVLQQVALSTSQQQVGWTEAHVNEVDFCLQGPCASALSSPAAPLPSAPTAPWSNGGYAVRGYPLLPVGPGTFYMGCTPGQPKDKCGSDEQPVTKVQLTQPFWLGEVEVTRSFWNQVLGLGPAERGDHPQANVTFCDVLVFANRLSEQEGLPPAYLGVPLTAQVGEDCTWADQVVWDRTSNGYRLPTEAEWEYAARAGTDLTYAGSNNLEDVGWADGNVHPVRGKAPNAWGFYDLSGNVWEWTYDVYRRELPGGQVVDPYVTTDAQRAVASKQSRMRGPRPDHFVTSGDLRVNRGGSTGNSGDFRRVSFRFRNSPDFSGYGLGFRLARGVPGPGSAP